MGNFKYNDAELLWEYNYLCSVNDDGFEKLINKRKKDLNNIIKDYRNRIDWRKSGKSGEYDKNGFKYKEYICDMNTKSGRRENTLIKQYCEWYEDEIMNLKERIDWLSRNSYFGMHDFYYD